MGCNSTQRRDTIPVKVGNIFIGKGYPIIVQSMTKTDTRNIEATVAQIKQLEAAGCEIVRIAVPDMQAAKCIGKIKKQVNIPIVADIHFNYRLALEAIKQGIDKLRLNPGNIRDKDKISAICNAAKDRNIPIRVGVNSGSIDRKRFKEATPEALVTSAIEYIELLEEFGIKNIVVSLKASDILTTIEAYKLMATRVQYPFHIGITEAGTIPTGSIKSAVGIGVLLASGIGDTIRVSLTADPIEEVRVAYQILQSLKLREYTIQIISCPTCGRTQVDLQRIVLNLEDKIKFIKKPLKVAVMGCVVNGPGEAADADIGIACSKNMGVLFKKGVIVRKRISQQNIVDILIDEINKYILENKKIKDDISGGY